MATEKSIAEGEANQPQINAGSKAKHFYAAVPLDVIRRLMSADAVASQVYLYLASRANFATLECYPSNSTIAEETGHHPDTVRRTIRKLVAIGAIEVKPRRRGDGRPDSHLYIVNLIPAPQGVSRAARSMDTRAASQVIPAPQGQELPSCEPPPIKRPNTTAASAAFLLEQIKGTSLDTTEGRMAMTDWIEYRQEKKKSLTYKTINAIIKKFDVLGPARFAGAVENSIAQGWQGLFEPGGNQNGGNKSNSQSRHEQRLVGQRYDPSKTIAADGSFT